MYAYPAVVVDQAWDGMVGGVDAWRSRLAKRACEQHAVEAVFGSEWRDIRWPKRQRTPTAKWGSSRRSIPPLSKNRFTRISKTLSSRRASAFVR